MTTQERTDFLAARKQGIGGSDVASLLAEDVEVKYGCKRRLWLDKSGVPADFPDEENSAIELGRILEPYIRAKYALHTGNDTQQVHQPFVHPKYPMLRVNVDGCVYFPNDRVAIQEIKCMGERMYFQTKREGIVPDYIFQSQHGILVGRELFPHIEFAVFTISTPVKFADPPISWDIEPNPDIHEAILRKGPEFWATLGDESRAPERLEPDDKRCQKCRWRVTCQGNALIQISNSEMETDESLRPLLAEYDERKGLFDEAEALLDETKEQLKTDLGERSAIMVPGKDKARKIYYRQQEGRSMVNTEGLMKGYEEMRKLLATAVPLGIPLTIPPASSFQYKGKPFKALRIY